MTPVATDPAVRRDPRTCHCCGRPLDRAVRPTVEQHQLAERERAALRLAILRRGDQAAGPTGQLDDLHLKLHELTHPELAAAA